MSMIARRAWSGLFCAALLPLAAHAADFAPKGAKARLVVDFDYQSSGRKADRLDSYEWKAARTLHMDVALVAETPVEWGSTGPDAAQQARAGKLQGAVAGAGTQMAPMMAGAQAVIARCGEDDACIERETAKLGFGMAGTSQLESAQRAGRAAADASRPGEAKVQRWVATAQTGSYAIAETSHRVHADPICMPLPGGRCTRDELRRGGGPLANSKGSLAWVEVDLGRQQFTLQLPMPIDALAYTETVITDEPAGTHETPTPKGPQPRSRVYVQTADGQPSAPPLRIALKGGWRSQAGEQTVRIPGTGPDGGTLTVRWRFTST